MPVEKLSKSVNQNNKATDMFINAGGHVPGENDKQEQHKHILLRIPIKLLEQIDFKRKERLCAVSRNQFILESIEKIFSE